VDVLASRKLRPGRVSEIFQRLEPEARMPVRVALDLLRHAVALSRDPDLGLHAALLHTADPPLLAYATVTAPTVREALATLARYIALDNDALELKLHEHGDVAVLEFRCSVPWSRAAIDFVMAGFYMRAAQWGFPGGDSAEIWFSYARPEHVRTHASIFRFARIRYEAGLDGLAFDSRLLDAPMPRADPGLHGILVDAARLELGKLQARLRVSQRALAIVIDDLLRCSNVYVARQLGMHPRTLSRHLHKEGVSLRALIDQARWMLALRYLLAEGLGPVEISRRLGFSEPTSFYKAFRRWFGSPPTAVRQRCKT
jgi:hypothetical protein